VRGLCYIFPTMSDPLPAGHRSNHGHRPVLLAFCALLALIGLLGRRASGVPLLPTVVLVGLQLPLLAAWLLLRCGLLARTRPEPAAGGAFHLSLTAIVFLVAGAAGAILRRAELSLSMLTVFVLSMLVVDAVSAWLRRVDESSDGRVLGPVVLGWSLVVLVGTAILATPLATYSSVPDYRHNFWRHVLFCAHTAASSVSLAGSTGYDIRYDYSAFGRAIIYLLMQLGGIGLTALAAVAMRSMTTRRIRVGRVLAWSLALQVAASVLLAPGWKAADTPDAAARAGWSLFHSAAALLNCGFFLRPDGLAVYLASGPIFVATTALGLIGSLGVPTLLALLPGHEPSAPRGRRREPDQAAASPPLQRLIPLEFWAALWLLIVGAVVVFFVESPTDVSAALRADRPVDLGPTQIPLYEMTPGARWRAAVFLAVTARSSGFSGIPLVEGAISGLTLGVMCLWMTIGGAVGSYAGGLRTTTILALLTLWLARPTHPMKRLDDAVRRRLRLRLLALVAFVPVLEATTLGLIALTQQATWWERGTEAVSAACGVGYSTGLGPHLTWPARCAVILAIMLGRLAPMAWWCRISAELSNAAPVAREARRGK